jgi:nitrogen fixation/metabolism regulation signal transduction histidine kinase
MMNKKYGIRTYVVWFTLMPLMLMVIVLETFMLHDRYGDLDRDLVTRGQLIARQLAASSEYGVFSDNREFLNGITESALQQPDVKGVVVMNARQGVLVSSADLSGAKDKTAHMLGLVSLEVPIFDNGDMLLLYQPILSTQVDLNEFEAKPAVQQVGAVVLKMSWEQTRHLKAHLLWFTVSVTASFLLVTLFLVQLASRRFTLPITKLSEAIHAIGDGQLDTRVAVPSCIRELCSLSSGINQMTADLQHERMILQQRINEATHQLRNIAFYDTLTLLPNRRLLNDRLPRHWLPALEMVVTVP